MIAELQRMIPSLNCHGMLELGFFFCVISAAKKTCGLCQQCFLSSWNILLVQNGLLINLPYVYFSLDD